MTEIEVKNIETNEVMVFKKLIDASAALGIDPSTLSWAVNNGSTINKKYRVRKVKNPIVIIEEYKPRIEGYDYQALRKHILSIISHNKCEGIVIIDESSRHNKAYYQIQLKRPDEELVKEIKNLMV